MSTPGTVLIIDDNALYVTLMKVHLLAAGLGVHISRTATEGRVYYMRFRPDLIIVDAGLTGINGPELLKHVRAQPGCAHLPVIMTSADTRKENREAVLMAGAEAFLPKPFTPKELRAAVRRFLPIPDTGQLTASGVAH